METPSDWVSAVQERVSQQKKRSWTLPCLRKMTSSFLDPESEFGSLVEALNGEVISISATSHTHLNALDMDSAYGNDKNPLIEKSEFILSLFEQLVGAGNLSAKEKSILDRCTADVYREYIRSGYQSEVPTLKDLYRQLMLQPEDVSPGACLVFGVVH